MRVSVKVFPGVHVSGRVGGRKRRRTRRPAPNRRPLPGPVKFGMVVFVIGCGIFGTTIFKPPAVQHLTPHSGTTTVTRADTTGYWPLTSDTVVLSCVEDLKVTMQINGVTYALSNTAQASGRWPSDSDIPPSLLAGAADSLQVRAGLSDLESKGEMLC